MSQDEIILIQSSVISYLGNARLHFEQGDYQRALSFLDLAQNEIQYLANHKAAEQSVQSDGATAERTMGVSCPYCNHQVQITLLLAPRR